jgi:membrane carboxypeptidase/penicillin-binding protein
MRAALRLSSNRAAVRMIQDVGIPATVEYAERFGMGRMPRVPSLALGAGEVTMLSLVSAYGTFANQGLLVPPTLIRRVTTKSGEVLYETKATAEQVVSPETAFLMTSMLEDVVNRGTGAQVRNLGFQRPAAGKTGTTNEYRDAWFIGYTPSLVTGVWVGYDKPRTIVPGGYAAQLAVPMWTRFMIAATRDERGRDFRAPGGIVGVTICPLSGKAATDACRHDPQVTLYTEYFRDGTAPTEFCPYHGRVTAAPLTLAASATAPSLRGSTVSSAAGTTAAEPLPEAAAPEATVAKAPEPAPQKKRGFWAKVFGVGRDDQKKK